MRGYLQSPDHHKKSPTTYKRITSGNYFANADFYVFDWHLNTVVLHDAQQVELEYSHSKNETKQVVLLSLTNGTGNGTLSVKSQMQQVLHKR